jgi:hypothetical protein
MALDAFDVIRSLRGPTILIHHIAHAGFIDSSDISRFKSLNVVADLSPPLWSPIRSLTASSKRSANESASIGRIAV